MYVNQIQEQGEVLIKHLSTDSIPSDALTKPLHGAPFKLHTDAVLMGRLPLQWISKAKTVVSKEGVCYDTATSTRLLVTAASRTPLWDAGPQRNSLA
jgi:hypothetical protein